MAKYFLTGAAGFIGSSLATRLLQEGHEIVGVDNLNDYYDVKLKAHRITELNKHKNFEFLPIDIENIDALKPILKQHQFEAILNLAARAGVHASTKFPQLYFSTNVTGTINLLELMKECGVKKILQASTSSVYSGCEIPFKESYNVNHPYSVYGASKLAAENVCHAYHHLYQFDVNIVRFFTVYGPLGRPDMSPFKFIRLIDEGNLLPIFGDGEQRRDFTYIDDIVSGAILAVKLKGFNKINLGGSQIHTLNEMIFILEKLLGKSAHKEFKPKVASDMYETLADVSQAQKLLNWTPKFNLEQGLKKTIEHYFAHHAFYRDLKI